MVRWYLFFVLVLVSPVSAQFVPKLVFPEIPGYIDVNGQGVYQKLLERAAANAGVRYTAEVLPRTRALALFEASLADGIFTFTQTARDQFGRDAILASYPVGAYRGYLFVLKGQPLGLWTTWSGRTVGGVRGFDGTYRGLVAAGVKIELVNDDAQNLAKLKAGRVAGVLAFLPDVYGWLPEVTYDARNPFFESYDRLTLFRSPEAAAWLAKLSASLKALHESGEAARLVGPAYLSVSGEFPPDR